MIEYTDEQHDSLIRGHRKQLTDAQATVEALQRERDQWKEAFERSCDDTAHLKAALDAERETSIIGKGEPPPQWSPNAQVRSDIS